MYRFQFMDDPCRVPLDGLRERIPDIHGLLPEDAALGVPHGYAASLGGDAPTAPPSDADRLARTRTRNYTFCPRSELGPREQCWSSDEMMGAAGQADALREEAILESVRAAKNGARVLQDLEPKARGRAWRQAHARFNKSALQMGTTGTPVFQRLSYFRCAQALYGSDWCNK